MSKTSAATEKLIRDFDHRYDGSTLIRCGIRGFTSDHVVGRFRSALSAAEYLLPLVRDAEYTRRFVRLTRAAT